MCGYDTKEQVDAAAGYETASEEEKDYASVLANAPFHSYRGECTYCGHCKPCVANLDIAMINKFYDLAIMQPEVPATMNSWTIRHLSASAVMPANPAVRSEFRSRSGWRRLRSYLGVKC